MPSFRTTDTRSGTCADSCRRNQACCRELSRLHYSPLAFSTPGGSSRNTKIHRVTPSVLGPSVLARKLGWRLARAGLLRAQRAIELSSLVVRLHRLLAD